MLRGNILPFPLLQLDYSFSIKTKARSKNTLIGIGVVNTLQASQHLVSGKQFAASFWGSSIGFSYRGVFEEK